MKIKLCGFTEVESLKVAVENKCDFVGFVFHDKSPRYIDLARAAEISKIVPNEIFKVAVLVDSDFSFLSQVASELKPQYFQFHGDESVDYLKEVRRKFSQKIIKAVRVSESKDLEQLKIFEEHCDLFLLDAKPSMKASPVRGSELLRNEVKQNDEGSLIEKEFGGSGKVWNWEILSGFKYSKDWMLAGGINVSNIESAAKITGAKLFDISSGIEKIRGKKSPELILELMRKVQEMDRI